MSNNHNWSASSYRANKAKRFEAVTPEWVTNPDTGAEFLLRRTGAMSAMIANYMPNMAHMADGVVAKWKEAGVEIDSKSQLSVVTPEKVAEGERDLKLMARIVAQSMIVPHLSTNPLDSERRVFIMKALMARDSEQKPHEVDFYDITLDPAELDDSDVLFIFKYATGQYGSLKGAEIASVDDLAQFHKQPAVMSRTGDVDAELSDTSEPIAATG